MTTGSDLILERMMSLHPKIMDLSLGRMHEILAKIGHPERRIWRAFMSGCGWLAP